MALWLCIDEDCGERKLKASVVCRSKKTEGATFTNGIACIGLGGIDPSGNGRFFFMSLNGVMYTDPATAITEMQWVASTSSFGSYQGERIISPNASISVEAVGTIKRYAKVEYGAAPGDSYFDEHGLHWYGGPTPEPHGHARITYVDRVEQYSVTWPGGTDTLDVTDISQQIGVGISIAGEVWASAPRGNPVYQDPEDDQWYLPAGVWDYRHRGADDTLGQCWIEGSWERKLGDSTTVEKACMQEQRYAWSDPVGGDAGPSASDLTVGGAVFSYVQGFENIPYNPSGFDQPFGTFQIADICGPFSVGEADSDIANMDGVPRSATIQGKLLRPVAVDTLIPDFPADPISVNYNGQISSPSARVPIYLRSYSFDSAEPEEVWPVDYAGHLYVTAGSANATQDYIDTPEPIQAFYDDPPEDVWAMPTFRLGDRVITPTTGDEPNHPPWEPTSPEFADNIALMQPPDTILELADALTLALAPAGSVVATPLEFDDAGLTWDPYHCTTTTDASGRKITVGAVSDAYIQIADLMAQKKLRLTGTAFADLHWDADRVGAELTLKIGPHSWNFTAESTGSLVSRFDLCHPDASDGDPSGGDQQSFCPYDQPFDLSELVETEVDPYYGYVWGPATLDYPAGWGVGFITSVKVECKTPNTVYHVKQIDLVRKSAAEGGFATLYVLPQSGPWNDTDALPDFAYPAMGGGKFVIPKARLVIDGAVVWELASGWTDGSQCYLYKLTRPIADGGIGYPLNDYTTPTAYGFNGVATIGTAAFAGSGLLDEYCLVASLEGGVYPEIGYSISVPMAARCRHWDITPGTEYLPEGSFHRFRGCVCGVAWHPDGDRAAGETVLVSTPNASAGDEEIVSATTNSLGWFVSSALNTKGAAEVETAAGIADITLRSRFYSRLCIVKSTMDLHLRYCESTGKIALNNDGKPTLTCCP